jgi:hypothetical protein
MLLAFSSNKANAEVFAWKDTAFDVSFVYPDEWRPQFNAHPDVKLHILAPQGRDFAACFIKLKEDGRYTMYPDAYIPRVNSIVFNTKALYDHYIEKDKVNIIYRSDYASLGRAHAVYAEADFVQKAGLGQELPMRSLLFATQSGKMNFVFECEAARANWDYWKTVFINMVRSVDFPVNQMSTANGYYRYFQDDGSVLMSTDNARTGSVEY